MKKFFTSLKPLEIGFLFLLGAIFISRLDLPSDISMVLDNVFAQLLIFIIVMYLLLNASVLVSIFLIVVLVDMISRSNNNNNSSIIEKSHESKKSNEFSNMNHQSYTLEQQMVAKMAPLVNSGSSVTAPSYKPMVENTHQAKKSA